jgi:hypothetical protein
MLTIYITTYQHDIQKKLSIVWLNINYCYKFKEYKTNMKGVKPVWNWITGDY